MSDINGIIDAAALARDFRVLALDLDGTVITGDYRLSDRVVSAVARFREGGRLFFVASGRARISSFPWVEKLGGADGLSAFNGASVWDGPAARERDGAPFLRVGLSECVARELLALARRSGLDFHAWSGEKWYYEARTPGVDFYEARSGLPGGVVDFDEVDELRWSKLMFVAPEDALAEFAPRLRETLGEKALVVSTGVSMLEVVPPGVSKAAALDAWLLRRGLGREDVLAFGDAENDLDMLLAAGVGVAMANGPEAVRSAVGRVCPSVEDDGVAAWLEEWLDARGKA
ncbi:MAG: HAD family hydrolase [Spirochaetales bacterium]|nr:HAD family hydrolase [Spirochaetales bacterium]